jgi:hypothetical protein
MSTEFEFKLSEPITYQGDLQDEKVKSIFLREPSNRHGIIRGELRQKLVRAFLSMSKNLASLSTDETKDNKTDDNNDLDADTIMLALYANDEPISDLEEKFIELLASGCGYINKSNELTKTLCGMISDTDFHNLMGKYFAAFIIPSCLMKASKK